MQNLSTEAISGIGIEQLSSSSNGFSSELGSNTEGFSVRDVIGMRAFLHSTNNALPPLTL